MFTFKQRLKVLFNTFMYLLTNKEEYRAFDIIEGTRVSIGEHAVTLQYHIKRKGDNGFTLYDMINKDGLVDVYVNGALTGRTVPIQKAMMLHYHCEEVVTNDGQRFGVVIENGIVKLQRNGIDL